MDFEGLAQALLPRAESLLTEWLPAGKKVGHEWVVGSLANEPGESCKTNLLTGKGADFATGEKWADLTALYAAMHHIKNGEAARHLADKIGYTNGRIAPAARLETPASPIPSPMPAVPAHAKHGTPTATYAYGDAFIICRYDLPDGTKEFSPLTWRNNKWAFKAAPDPKPLFNLEGLAKHPKRVVLIVEGEQCATIGELPIFVRVTWAGGSNAVKKTDFSALKGRDVILWPDNDEPGFKAMAQVAEMLHGVANGLRIIKPDERAVGWDLADAIKAGWDQQRVRDWITDRIAIKPVEVIPASKPAPIAVGASVAMDYDILGLTKQENGRPHATMSNISLIIQAHPRFAGKFYYDTFRNKFYHTLHGPEQQLRDRDHSDICAYVQQSLKLEKANRWMVIEGVEHACHLADRNSLTDYLNRLVWDGTPRLSMWLWETLGVAPDPYTETVARNWPIAMVARAFEPGCKMDNMLVLEGVQGRYKTSFLEILGDPWYMGLSEAFGDKDFLQSIQGVWLIEIPDMTSFTRKDHTHIIATITIRNDRYRASYGRYTEDHKRVAVFAATSETSNYLSDPRGRRRYWPLRCGTINLDRLHAIKDQVFAEAVVLYRAAASWWEVPARADVEQMERVVDDPWLNRIKAYIETIDTVQVGELLTSCLEIHVERQTRREVIRIHAILKQLEWHEVFPKDKAGKTYRAWKRGKAWEPIT